MMAGSAGDMIKSHIKPLFDEAVELGKRARSEQVDE
jgi:hypothetical protein